MGYSNIIWDFGSLGENLIIQKFLLDQYMIRRIQKKINDFTGYYKAEVYDFYHNGLMVRAYPYVKNIKYKLMEFDSDEYEIVDLSVEILGCIPFENIIEYDMDGDEYYMYPHLFCDFVNVSDPYEKIVYRAKGGWDVDEECIIQE